MFSCKQARTAEEMNEEKKGIGPSPGVWQKQNIEMWREMAEGEKGKKQWKMGIGWKYIFAHKWDRMHGATLMNTNIDKYCKA